MEKEIPLCGKYMHQNYQGQCTPFQECVRVAGSGLDKQRVCSRKVTEPVHKRLPHIYCKLCLD